MRISCGRDRDHELFYMGAIESGYAPRVIDAAARRWCFVAFGGLAGACMPPSDRLTDMPNEMDDTSTSGDDTTSNISPELLPPRATIQRCQPLRTDLNAPSLALHDRIVAPVWSDVAGTFLSPESVPRMLVVEPTGLIWSTALRDANNDASVQFLGQLHDSLEQVDAVVADWIDGYWKLFALGRTQEGRLELQGYVFDGTTLQRSETLISSNSPTQRTRSGSTMERHWEFQMI